MQRLHQHALREGLWKEKSSGINDASDQDSVYNWVIKLFARVNQINDGSRYGRC